MWQLQAAGYGRDSLPIQSYGGRHMSTAGVDKAAGTDFPAQYHMQPDHEGQTAFSWGLQVGLPIDTYL